MNDFLVFRKMITPMIIQIIFWVGVAICVIGGLVGIFLGVGQRYGSLFEVLVLLVPGLLLLIIGPLVVRVWCELLILFFRMNETLTEIKNNTEHRV
jgi:hypothetical protein